MQKIPIPEFIVLYNGTKPFPAERTLRLSDAYKATDEAHRQCGNLDLTVRVVNINPGVNNELMQKSEALNGYTELVEHVRHSKLKGLNLTEAINEAISWGMNHGVLKSFLSTQGLDTMYCRKKFT